MTKPQGNESRKRPNRTREHLPLEEFIPPYLRRFVHPYHGDFCFCYHYHPQLLAQIMSEGFLPIATETAILPKLHEKRCVINLAGARDKNLSTASSLHISKSTRKKAKRFMVTINKAFDDVVQGCREQHGNRCWLYPKLVACFKAIHENSVVHAMHIPTDGTIRPDIDQQQTRPVRVYSIEIWNAQTGQLAGGELGYTVGSVYTSLTGFSRQDSAGSVQLLALGRLLESSGFTLWDLGMEMDYKLALGCHLMPRRDFICHIHDVRVAAGHLVLKVSEGSDPVSAKDVIDKTLEFRSPKETVPEVDMLR